MDVIPYLKIWRKSGLAKKVLKGLHLGILALGCSVTHSGRAAPSSPRLVTFHAGLHLHIFAPPNATDSATSAVLLFHPGGWTEGTPRMVYSQAQAFASHGITAIAVEYRLSGASATPADAYNDACAAFAFVRNHAAELRINSQHIAAFGASAGGQLAALSATRGCKMRDNRIWRPQLLMLHSPALDPTKISWYTRLLKGAAIATLQPINFANHSTPSTVIVQGEADTLSPLSISKRFCRKIVRPGATCQVIAHHGLGHFFTRTVDDQDGQFNPFKQDGNTTFSPDKIAETKSTEAFVDFLISKKF